MLFCSRRAIRFNILAEQTLLPCQNNPGHPFRAKQFSGSVVVAPEDWQQLQRTKSSTHICSGHQLAWHLLPNSDFTRVHFSHGHLEQILLWHLGIDLDHKGGQCTRHEQRQKYTLHDYGNSLRKHGDTRVDLQVPRFTRKSQIGDNQHGKWRQLFTWAGFGRYCLFWIMILMKLTSTLSLQSLFAHTNEPFQARFLVSRALGWLMIALVYSYGQVLFPANEHTTSTFCVQSFLLPSIEEAWLIAYRMYTLRTLQNNHASRFNVGSKELKQWDSFYGVPKDQSLTSYSS